MADKNNQHAPNSEDVVEQEIVFAVLLGLMNDIELVIANDGCMRLFYYSAEVSTPPTMAHFILSLCQQRH